LTYEWRVYIKQAEEIFWEQDKYWRKDRVSEGDWITRRGLTPVYCKPFAISTPVVLGTEVGINLIRRRLTAATAAPTKYMLFQVISESEILLRNREAPG